MIGHLARLVALGVPFDTPDGEGLTPVQIAGWEGLPDIMAYLLSLKPDLGHINGYGGTLLSTILHGSENNPNRAAATTSPACASRWNRAWPCRAGRWRLQATRRWPSSWRTGRRRIRARSSNTGVV
jgi:hypothetical protein